LTPFSIALVLISALIHSSWNFFTKRGNWPGEFFFWVFLWGVLLYLPFFIAFGAFPSFLLQAPPKLWWLTISSGFFETVYFICLVAAYRGGDLSLVYPISRSAPLFTQIWAIFFIGEILSSRGVGGIVLVMIGLFVISLKDFHIEPIIPQPNRFASRPYLLALTAAVASSIYSVIDKVGVQMLHPALYIWFINLWMATFTGLYLILRREVSFLKIWKESKKEILIIAILQNIAYLLVLMALQMSKVSYVVAFRQAGALFGAAMGIYFLKESYWKTRITGALILTVGLLLIGLAK
jgi:drug/metabolite transporter (DMT)-like permease